MVILSRENMNRKYTKETISILKENYPKHGYKKCKEITGLSKKAIQCLAQRHNIYKLPNNRIGEVFGRLKIVEKGSKIGINQKWLCQCECGDKKEIFYSNLQNGDIRSCGCLYTEMIDKLKIKEYKKRSHVRISPHHWGWKRSRWRKQLLEKYDFACVLSGIKTGRLEAHHLFNQKAYPDLQYDPENGVILQRELHQLFHKLYGREINDPKQFEEFRLKYKQGLTVAS